MESSNNIFIRIGQSGQKFRHLFDYTVNPDAGPKVDDYAVGAILLIAKVAPFAALLAWGIDQVSS